jgi:hypothetical protein
VFPPHTDNFQKVIKFKSDLGNEFFGKKGEKLSEEKPQPKESQKPKPKPIPFHCEDCGRDGHLSKFYFRRKRDERFSREMANKERYSPSRVEPEPRMVPRGEGLVYTVPRQGRHEFVLEVCHHKEMVIGVLGLGMVSLLDIPSLVVDTSMGGTIVALGSRGAMGHGLHFVVHVVVQGDFMVACLEAIRILLVFSVAKGFKLYQMDVKSAFLNGFLEEEVYVRQPPGFKSVEFPHRVYKPRKALYGLTQAPRAWYGRLGDSCSARGLRWEK